MLNVTELLAAAQNGSQAASQELLPLVYDELRQLAAQRLAREKPGQTLQATALVHEAYVRLVGAGGESSAWSGRNHFFAAAAEAMRRILVESARRKLCEKRGGGEAALSLGEFDVPGPHGSLDAAELLSLDEALERLASEDPQKAELVKLRYFAGLSLEETAAALGVSRATASRYWDYARSWLFAELSK